MVSSGAITSNLVSREPHKKNSASNYSKFNGNFKRLISYCRMLPLLQWPKSLKSKAKEPGRRKINKESIKIRELAVLEMNNAIAMKFAT